MAYKYLALEYMASEYLVVQYMAYKYLALEYMASEYLVVGTSVGMLIENRKSENRKSGFRFKN